MGSKDPYLDFLNTDSLLFSTSTKPLGKDPLKFSDPLSFGLNDPLSFGSSDKKSSDKKDKDDADKNDFDAESRHSGDDDASAPPMDYLGYIQVNRDRMSLRIIHMSVIMYLWRIYQKLDMVK